jgi:nucleoside-diphosphate-sugar epimerase
LTILITGATGLIGQNLVSYIVNQTFYKQQPHKVRILVRKRVGSPPRERFIHEMSSKGVDIFWGDLSKTADVLKFTKVSDPNKSVLIHCGAVFNFYQTYEHLYNVNVIGTMRILRGFFINQIKKLVFLSSAAVYGTLYQTNGQGVTEENSIDTSQKKSYELTKSLSEELVWQYQKKHPQQLITVLRPSGIIGGQGLTSDIFARMFFGRYVPLPKGGKERLSLVDVNDVVRAIIHFSNFKHGNKEMFNLVSYSPILRNVLLAFAEALQRKNVKIISIPLFLFKPMYYMARLIRIFKEPTENSLLLPVLFDKLGKEVYIDNSKGFSHGFIPKFSLVESMNNFQKFLSENPWYAEKKFKIAL